MVFIIFTSALWKFNQRNRKSVASEEGSSGSFLMSLITASALMIIAVGIYAAIQKQAKLKQQNELIIAQQSILEKAEINAGLMKVLSESLRQLNAEMATDSQVSESTIHQIIELSKSFIPHRLSEYDSLTDRLYSKERAQLLHTLINSEVDSVSYQQIIAHASFEYADLRGVDLSGQNLSGINLANADLSRSNLSDAFLRGGSFDHAHMPDTDFSRANISNASFIQADCSWCVLDEVVATETNFHGVNLQSAKLRSGDFSLSDFSWSVCLNANFEKSKIIETDLRGATLRYSNLSYSVLNGSNFIESDLHECILQQSSLQRIKVVRAVVNEKDWFELLKKWEVSFADSLSAGYKLIPDKFGVSNYMIDKK